MHRRIMSLPAVLALGALLPSFGGAQAALEPPAATLALTVAPAPAALKATYHLMLTSTWPQEQTAGGCLNGGVETVEGTLSRGAGGNYTGRLNRRTELLFCGAHGEAAHGEAAQGGDEGGCALTLRGQGTVAMTGVVMGDEGSPSGRAMRATWTPSPEHQATVTGACAAAFKDAVRAMYLSTPHAVEFPLTTAGTGPRSERLENYAWAVELN
jgi:hypothetical protein